MKNITQSLKIITIAILISFGLSYVYAWTAPTVSAPNGNVSAPINTSTSQQTKAGNLVVTAIITGNSVVGTTEVKSPVFTDSDNILYSVDPNNTSYFLNIINTGTTTTNGLKVANGAGADKVLTSDASGNATWQAAAGSGGASGGVLSIAMTKAYSTRTSTTWTAPAGVTGVTVMIAGGGGSGGGAYCYANAAWCDGSDGGDTSAFGQVVRGGKHGVGAGGYGANGAGGLGGSGGVGGYNYNGVDGVAGGGSGGGSQCGPIMDPLLGCSGGYSVV